MSAPASPVEPVPAKPRGELAQVYVWEAPVRATHWLVALSLVGLAVTGLFIAHPVVGPSAPTERLFDMSTIKAIHSYLAIVFTLSVLARVAWMFLGNKYARWDKLLPVRKIRRDGFWPTVRFYLFLRRKPPGFVGHNPLAGLAYSLVFGLYFVMILTGFALYAASASEGSWAGAFDWLLPLFGSLQVARWIHHAVTWLLIGFAVHHVYSAVLMSQVEANATVESIFSGYKFVPKEDLVYSGYRFIDRKTDEGG